MASEIYWRGTFSGVTDYVTIRSVARQYWNTSGTPAFENLTVANWGNYAIALTETPASSYFYVGTWPATLTTSAFYWVDVFRQLGAAPAIGDSLLGTLLGYWDGTTFKPWADDLANWLGVLPLALSSQQVQAVIPSSTVVASVSGAVGSVTADVGITQAGADKVWSSATRTLTAFGTLVADVATAVWGAAARTLTAFGFSVTVGTNNDKTGYALTSAYDPAKTAAQAGDAMTLTAAERTAVANALLDLADSIEAGLPVRGTLRLIAAACAGKSSGFPGATDSYRNAVADTKARITATTDADGNRTAIIWDIT